MATIEGAQADLHVSVQAGDEVGSLEVGKQADLILVDLTELNLSPVLEAPVRNAGLLQQLLRALSLYELPPLV